MHQEKENLDQDLEVQELSIQERFRICPDPAEGERINKKIVYSTKDADQKIMIVGKIFEVKKNIMAQQDANNDDFEMHMENQLKNKIENQGEGLMNNDKNFAREKRYYEIIQFEEKKK